MNDSASTNLSPSEQSAMVETQSNAHQLLPSRITDVTIFRQGVVVRRRAVVEEGQLRLRIAGLPLALRDSSVRVHGEGLSAQEATVILALAPSDPSLRSPQSDALEEAKLNVRMIEARLASVDTMIAHVTSLWVSPRSWKDGGCPGPTPFEERQKLVSFRRSQLDTYQNTKLSIQEKLRTATKERDHLERQWRETMEQNAARENELRKAVDVSCNGKAGVLFIDYELPGASWRPSYALRLDAEMENAQLEMRAIIAQRTGEDWTDANVLLSTASPLAHTDLPVLRSVRIGRYQPPPQTRGYRPPPPDTDALFRDYDDAFARRLIRNAPAKPAKSRSMPHPTAPPPFAAPPPPAAAPPAPPPPVMAPLSEVAASFAPGGPVLASGMAASPPTVEKSISRRRSRSSKQKKREQPKGVMKSLDLEQQQERADSFADHDNPAEASFEPGDDWLSFSDLHISGANTSSRGRLRPFDGAPKVANGTLSGTRIRGQIRHARSRALELSPVPNGHIQPRDVDGFDFVFEVDAPVTLESSGRWASVPLTRADADVRLGFVVVPRESRDVFRFAKLENPIDAPLLPGPLDVYLAGRFLLGRVMPTVGPKELLELGLGVEQRIKVARNTRYEESAAGMLRGSLDLEHSIEVELISHLDRIVELEVRERVPFVVEENDDIEMHVHHTSPPWNPIKTDEDLRGGYRWNVRLKKGEKKILEAKYTVRISSKNELVGGNRRES